MWLQNVLFKVGKNLFFKFLSKTRRCVFPDEAILAFRVDDNVGTRIREVLFDDAGKHRPISP